VTGSSRFLEDLRKVVYKKKGVWQGKTRSKEKQGGESIFIACGCFD